MTTNSAIFNSHKRCSLNVRMQRAILKLSVGLAVLAGFCGSASALEFSVSNLDLEPIEIAIAYETDQGASESKPQSAREIKAYYLLQPGQTGILFTYDLTLNNVWVEVRYGKDKRVWQGSNRETFDITSNSLTCTTHCTVNKFGDFSGNLSMEDHLSNWLLSGRNQFHFTKILSQLQNQSAVFQWKTPPENNLKVCNNTERAISLALGYFNQQSGQWMSNGWTRIDQKACSQQALSFTGSVYGYATDDVTGKGSAWLPSTKEASFCIDSVNNFTLPYQACSSDAKAGYRLETFGELGSLSNGLVTWNINP